ncbi:hypothetical protein OIU84_000520 [Salix udensis]|uniref:Cell wall hydroxyproline-rich glycoprotein n=1 Tax=Salix udensis TaxID=889485 RepID=A0AAD6PMG1_9ROSI|nr:hypothetical protein OIU84_000520 [Salix udensis]
MKKTTRFHLRLSLLVALFLGAVVCLSAAEQAPTISSYGGLSDAEAMYIRKRQLLYYKDENGDRGERVTPTGLDLEFANMRGFFCAPAPDNKTIRTVAGIDLNHGDIAGYLPEELGLLVDLALFHINSNRFCGTVPFKFKNMRLLFELDLSNNRFAGKFPRVVLKLPSLKFLDLRFNEFEGTVPKELFEKSLDAIFINHNRFVFDLPENLGSSPVSVIVLANNKFHGCVPSSLVNGSVTRHNWRNGKS